jgi:sulfoxide reductase heme-binding subunit YedZ
MKRFSWEKRILKPAVFLLSLAPMAVLLWRAASGTFGANPIEDITEETGIWTLRFLVITLSVTPLCTITGWSPAGSFRRMFGLFAFFYGFLHFSTYLALDQFFAFHEILRDVAKRPFITVGFASFILMIPLALTSPHRVVRWMGGKRWRLLHRTVYAVALGGVIHYLWLVKADTSRPLRYGVILAMLFLFRLWTYLSSKRRAAGSANRSGPRAE